MHVLQRGRRSVALAAVPAVLLACAALAVGFSQPDQRGPGEHVKHVENVKPVEHVKNVRVGKWTVRTPAGQPDLQGVWTNYDPTPFERLNADERPPQQPGVSTADWLVQDSPISARRPSMVVDPPSGRVPLRREAVEKRDRDLALPTDSLEHYGPWERCITRGVPGAIFPGAYNNGHRIVQTADYFVIHSEMIHQARVISLDGRPHLSPSIRSWDGDSRGRWVGDTLVVDTTNFNGKGWIATNVAAGWIRGVPQSEACHLVERFTRVDADTIEYEVTIDDPNVYTASWTVAFPLNRDDRYQLFEYACHEGNYSLGNMLRMGATAPPR